MAALKRKNLPPMSLTHLWDPVGFIWMWDVYTPSDKLLVEGNLGQGSEGAGVAFPVIRFFPIILIHF